MLETIREYASERLEEAGEAASRREAHARQFLALAHEAAAHWEGKERDRWLKLLHPEQANFEAALTTLLETDPEAAGQLAGDLWVYWDDRGRWAEGRARLSAALAGHDYAPPLRVRLLIADGFLAVRQGRYDEAADRAQEAARLAEEGDRLTLARTRDLQAWLFYYADESAQAVASAKEALDLLPEETHITTTLGLRRMLGVMERDRGDYEAARNRFESILVTAREHADQESLSETLDDLGDLYRLLGDYERAHELMIEAVELSRAASNRRRLARSLTNLGRIEREEGHNARANVLVEEAIEISRSLGARHALAMALGQRALTAFAEGEGNQSRLDTQEALRICQDVGDRQGIAATIEHLASIAVADHEPQTAAQLVGAATAIREAIDFPRDERRKAKIADIRIEAVAELGADAVRDLEAEGAKMPIEQAIELALSIGTAQALGA
jgi:tetratricopeptide (TPR) repeat protein